ncbi:MAG TPA: hypothetical protein VGI37_15765 [Streptosporangiaceae bacterium]
MAGDSAARGVGAGARTRLRSVLDRAAAPGGGASRPSGTVRPARRWLRPALAAAGFAGLGALLFLAYLGESWTLPVNSDGAGNALQAWAMLHSNLLLHGWILTDVSFYTTELPQYMLVELVRGLGPDVIHVAAAMTYTLLVLLVALLAKGRSSGRAAAARMLLAGGILLAPALGLDASTLLSSPDHTGTMVPLLVMWLIVDRAGRRWYVPAAAGIILALATVADTATLLVGTVPVIIVCLLRLLQDRRPGTPRRFELAMAGAAAASAVTAWLAIRLIRAIGGFVIHPVPLAIGFAKPGALERHLQDTAEGIVILFGGSFFGGHSQPTPGFFGAFSAPNPAVGALHLVGLALAAWALCIAVRHCYRTTEFVVAGLAVAVLLIITAYLFSRLSGTLISVREIVGVLPMTAVLAGRLLPDRLAAWMRAWATAARARGDQPDRPRRAVRRLAVVATVSVLLAAGAGYAANLTYNATRRSVPAQYHPVASWLAAHHLDYGLGGYWQANSITLQTMGRVAVRTIYLRNGDASVGGWETQESWYNPRLHHADFVVESPGKGDLNPVWLTEAFGRPAHVYRVAGSMVLTWHKNLLTGLDTNTPFAPDGAQD